MFSLANHARRPLVVKARLTGQRQVNGSNLSREESVRLELRYVENWPFALGLAICGEQSWCSSGVWGLRITEEWVETNPDPGYVALLVRHAAGGDVRAWECLVDQFSRLIWSITGEFRLVESDAADVVQTTWLRLLEHISRLDYPDRVGSWLAATARNECLRSLASHKRLVLGSDQHDMEEAPALAPEVDARLLADERAEVVRDALSHLPRRWQRLLELLMADPPASYAEISDQLGLPIGSIGPTRGRCLARLRVLLQAP